MIENIKNRIIKGSKWLFIFLNFIYLLENVLELRFIISIFFLVSTLITIPYFDKYISFNKIFRYIIAVICLIIGINVKDSIMKPILAAKQQQEDSIKIYQDRIKVEKEQQEIAVQKLEQEKIYNFQKNWADSTVKSWKGKFIVNSKIDKLDEVFFEFGEAASKSFQSNRKDHLPAFENDYKYKAGLYGFPISSCRIDFIPSSKIDLNKWEAITLVWIGADVYSGIGYDKKYVGLITNKIIVNGEKTVVITTKNGKSLLVSWEDIRRYAYFYESADVRTKTNNHQEWREL